MYITYLFRWIGFWLWPVPDQRTVFLSGTGIRYGLLACTYYSFCQRETSCRTGGWGIILLFGEFYLCRDGWQLTSLLWVSLIGHCVNVWLQFYPIERYANISISLAYHTHTSLWLGCIEDGFLKSFVSALAWRLWNAGVAPSSKVTELVLPLLILLTI